MRISLTQDQQAVDQLVHSYGDLIYDFCNCVLLNQVLAQIAFKSIVREIRRTYAKNTFKQYERSWVIRVAAIKLEKINDQYKQKLSPSERIMLDSILAPESRLELISSFMYRLSIEQRILVFLRDKYGLSYSEIAAALTIPEETLKLRRQQALSTLEQWIWSSA